MHIVKLSESLQYNFLNDWVLEQLLKDNPVLFMRRMSGYVQMARPMIQTPKEFVNMPFILPLFGESEQIMDGVLDEWHTGQIDYEMVVVREIDANGDTLDYPAHVYNPLTGIITFYEIPNDGAIMSADFYSDGRFEIPVRFVPDDYIHLLRIAVLAVYDERFASSSLDRVQKPSDRTFTVGSEANWLRENAAKAGGIRALLNSEGEKIEQRMTLRR